MVRIRVPFGVDEQDLRFGTELHLPLEFRQAIVFGDINASTIAVTDGAIIQGYVNTTFLSKEDSRSVFPEAISVDKAAENKA